MGQSVVDADLLQIRQADPDSSDQVEEAHIGDEQDPLLRLLKLLSAAAFEIVLQCFLFDERADFRRQTQKLRGVGGLIFIKSL